MKRRLLIGRGLIDEPRLVILDEPTTGLAPQARPRVWKKLRELKRRGCATASSSCTQGKFFVEGTPAQLIAEHVAPAVVELTAATQAELDRLVAEVAPYAGSHEVLGDRVVLHTEDGEALLKAVNDAGISYETATFRQASLEDVFLNLIGRTLEE